MAMEALKCYSESSEDEHSSVSETGITKKGNHSPSRNKSDQPSHLDHSPSRNKGDQPSHHDHPLTVERDQPIAKKGVHPEQQTVKKKHCHGQTIAKEQPLARNIDQTDRDVAKEEEHPLDGKGKHEHHMKGRQQSSRKCAESCERKRSAERPRRMSDHSSRKRHELGHHHKRSDSRSPERRHYSRRSPPRHHSHHRRRSRSRSRSPHHYRKSHSPVRHRSPVHQHHHSSRKTDSSLGNKQHNPSDFEEKQSGKAEDNGSKNEKAQVSDTVMPSNKESGAELSSKSADNSTQLTLEQQVERAIVAAQALAPKLPSYMNPGAMNPLKFQSIQEKRKLLWGNKKKEEQSSNKWESVSFEGEEGDKAQEKFRRLMGINPSSKTLVESQKMESQPTVLHSLQQQYDTSRYLTHIARGAGLGYGTDLQSGEPEQQFDKL